MTEKSREASREAALSDSPSARRRPSPAVVVPPTREAMSWIRALANDWEDERSHSEAAK